MDEDLMAIEKRWAETMQGRASGQCLEADALLELAEHGKRSRNYGERMAHVAVCRNCRETFKLLQNVELARPKHSLGWLFQPRTGFAAVAVAAAALAIFFINQRGVDPRGPEHSVPIAGTNSGGGVKTTPNTPKEIEKPKERQEIVRAVTPSTKTPRFETPRKRKDRGGSRKPVTPERESFEIPKGSMFAESTGQPGILEGEVVYTMVLEGEVERGEVLQGQVTAKPPQTPKVPPPLKLQ